MKNYKRKKLKGRLRRKKKFLKRIRKALSSDENEYSDDNQQISEWTPSEEAEEDDQLRSL